MKPKISVIMPAYNTEKYIWLAVESILNQSFTDFEFIIIDDFSSDNTFKILEEFAKKDNRIKLFKNERNMWISYTRNKLIWLCNTNYIVSQDSDDISNNYRLELSYNFLEKNKTFWVVSWNNEIIDEDWVLVWYRKYSNDIWNIILKKSPISNASCMFRKKLFIDLLWYDEKLNYWEDYDLRLKFFRYWYWIKNLDENLIQYRIRKWQTKIDKLKDTIKNTIFIQKRAIKLYWITPSFSDKLYLILENILLYLPNNFILFLFKKLEYKKWR